MVFIKLFLLSVCILLTNKCLIKIDYYKFFKKNSDREIFIINMLFSISIGYMVYSSIMYIYELTSNIFN